MGFFRIWFWYAGGGDWNLIRWIIVQMSKERVLKTCLTEGFHPQKGCFGFGPIRGSEKGGKNEKRANL
jgi:hypothetical protein